MLKSETVNLLKKLSNASQRALKKAVFWLNCAKEKDLKNPAQSIAKKESQPRENSAKLQEWVTDNVSIA